MCVFWYAFMHVYVEFVCMHVMHMRVSIRAYMYECTCIYGAYAVMIILPILVSLMLDYCPCIIAGVMTHSLDYRKSAGAFIHGFRYTGMYAYL